MELSTALFVVPQDSMKHQSPQVRLTVAAALGEGGAGSRHWLSLNSHVCSLMSALKHGAVLSPQLYGADQATQVLTTKKCRFQSARGCCSGVSLLLPAVTVRGHLPRQGQSQGFLAQGMLPGLTTDGSRAGLSPPRLRSHSPPSAILELSTFSMRWKKYQGNCIKLTLT